MLISLNVAIFFIIGSALLSIGFGIFNAFWVRRRGECR
jgi:hypothetical protein